MPQPSSSAASSRTALSLPSDTFPAAGKTVESGDKISKTTLLCRHQRHVLPGRPRFSSGGICALGLGDVTPHWTLILLLGVLCGGEGPGHHSEHTINVLSTAKSCNDTGAWGYTRKTSGAETLWVRGSDHNDPSGEEGPASRPLKPRGGQSADSKEVTADRLQ